MQKVHISDANSKQNALHKQIANVVQAQLDKPIANKLYLIATPIGNLADMSLRALCILTQVDMICCEDTRHSKKLLSNYDITSKLQIYHDHSDDKKRQDIISFLEKGQSVALISDAGTPLISDPGYKLVRDVLDHGFKVESIPGPSAPLVALTSSGLPTNRFLFEGFLAPKQVGRIKQLKKLKHLETTLIFLKQRAV